MINSSHFKYRKRKGFTLIEALIMVIIFSIMTIGFYRLYGLVILNIIESKKRLAAVEIANQELETLRNTLYQDIALIDTGSLPTGSIVPGPVEYDSIIDVGGNSYRILREMYYIDNPEDNIAPNDPDEFPQDYKNIIITVLWGSGISDTSLQNSQVQLSSYFVPPRGNELGITHGIVSVNVVDYDGAVAGMHVGITDINGVASPNYTDSGVTDASGNITFPAVPGGQKVYRLTVGDGTDGYEVITTVPDYPTTPYYPVYPDLSVVPGTVTTVTIENNKVPDLEFYSSDPYCGPIGNVTFDLEGGRILGTEPGGDIVYLNGSLSSISVTTDANGYYDMDNFAGFQESAGIYEVSFSSGLYTVWRLSPGDDVIRTAIQVEPDIAVDCNLIIMDNALDSVFVEVIDEDTGSPVPEAVVRLRNVGLGYSVNTVSDKYGTSYFPENGTVGLTNGAQYELRVTGAGYEDNQSLVTVTGLETVSVILQSSAP